MVVYAQILMVFGFGGKKKYSFECSSVGMNCGYSIKKASTEEELLEILKIHANKAHGIKNIPNDLVEKIKNNIRKE